MRLLAIGIEHAFDVPVQRPHDQTTAETMPGFIVLHCVTLRFDAIFRPLGGSLCGMHQVDVSAYHAGEPKQARESGQVTYDPRKLVLAHGVTMRP